MSMHDTMARTRRTQEALENARSLARQARDEEAKQAYIEILRGEPTNFPALNELGTLALKGGFRSAARTAYTQAVALHPGNAVGRVNLGNVLREDGEVAGARTHYQAALAIDPDLPEAHQGMAWVESELGLPGAKEHRRRGFEGRALLTQPHRGAGTGVPLVLLVSARGGNIPTGLWIDDRRFTIHAVYADYYDPKRPLPPHALLVNAIGDADLCAEALACAEVLAAGTAAPVINPPARVRPTGRAQNARRLGNIPGVVAPRVEALPRAALDSTGLEFPLLLRSPGFHTGRHFVYVGARADLGPACAALAGDEVLAIQYLDARGADGMARKYRVMFVDGRLYPLHLAVSSDWKVHYFSADMAHNAAFRAEENRFLEDMPGVLGARAVRTLEEVRETLGLDYAGIDFALGADGSILLFEANATMVVFPPGPDPMWDYRRGAIDTVIAAASRMLEARIAAAAAR
jgi:Tfp pilus assembly protein PilF